MKKLRVNWINFVIMWLGVTYAVFQTFFYESVNPGLFFAGFVFGVGMVNCFEIKKVGV